MTFKDGAVLVSYKMFSFSLDFKSANILRRFQNAFQINRMNLVTCESKEPFFAEKTNE